MKIKSLSAVLAKQFGVQAAEEIAPNHPTLGDVTSPEDLDRYQSWKRAYKKAARGAGCLTPTVSDTFAACRIERDGDANPATSSASRSSPTSTTGS